MGKTIRIDTENLDRPRTQAVTVQDYVNRVRRVKAEIKDLNGDVADIYASAVADGLDKDVLKALIKRLEKDPSILEAQDNLLALYESQYHNAELEAEVPSRARTRLDA